MTIHRAYAYGYPERSSLIWKDTSITGTQRMLLLALNQYCGQDQKGSILKDELYELASFPFGQLEDAIDGLMSAGILASWDYNGEQLYFELALEKLGVAK